MDKLIVNNFRNIINNLELDLNPVTILTGTNNSGKSNIIKLLVVLNDYFESNNHLVLNFNGPNSGKHKIDCYRNAINWINWNDNKALRISFKRDQYWIALKFIQGSNQVNHDDQKGDLESIRITHNINKSKILLKRQSNEVYMLEADQLFILTLGGENEVLDPKQQLRINLQKQLETINTALESTKYYIDTVEESHETSRLEAMRFHYTKQMSILDAHTDEQPIKFLKYFVEIDILKLYTSNLTISSIIESALSGYYNKETVNLSESKLKGIELEDLSKFSKEFNRILKISTIHLGPNRYHQMRLYLNEIKTDINEIVSERARNPFPKDSPADQFLIKWMKAFDIGTEYRFNNIKGIACDIEIRDKERWINLADKGFGSGQILSILLRLAEYLNIHLPEQNNLRRHSYEFPPIIVIEEPEANLHPAFQTLLATMFDEICRIAYVRIVIESHSEYFIRKTQSIVKNLSVNMNDKEVLPFSVYYFDKKNGAYKMEYRADGKFSNEFGSGFFDETRKLISDIL